GHEKVTPGQGGERIEGTKPYQYGDPVSELDIHQTLRNALQRNGLPGRKSDEATKRRSDERKDENTSSPSSLRRSVAPSLSTAIKFSERDFELHLHEGMTSCSTVVLLDMSGSMMRYGRFLAAKRVAMAMQALVRSRFPQDSIDFLGFYSGSTKIPE